MAYGNINKIHAVKNYKNYTEEEIIEMVTTLPSNQYEYDSLIDQLYFINDSEKEKGKKNRSHRRKRIEYSVLTARSMKREDGRNADVEDSDIA